MTEEDKAEDCSTVRRRRVGFFSCITIEPVAFMFTLSYGLTSIISQNLLIKKVCEASLGLNTSTCDDSNNNSSSNEVRTLIVEQDVALLNTYTSIAAGAPGILICLLLGAWSDNSSNGRKPLVLLPLIGHVLAHALLLLLSMVDLGPEWLVLSGLLRGLLGGLPCLLVGAFGLVSDASSARSRTARVAALDLALFAGHTAGAAISAVVFDRFGYGAVFAAAVAVGVVNVAYLVLVVREKERRTMGTSSSSPMIRCSQVVDTLGVCFRRRRGRGILLALVAAKVAHVAFTCSSLTYLYTRSRFGWSEREFSAWTSVHSVVACVGVAVVVPALSCWMGAPDGLVGAAGAASAVAASLVAAFADRPWMMYLSSAVGILELGESVVIRSVLSKLAGPGELGRIFSVVSSLESAMPLLAGPAVTLVYNGTVGSPVPGAVYLLQACMNVVVMGVMVCLFVWERRRTDYGVLVEEDGGDYVDDATVADVSVT